jgi:trimeric autotransporter adhesin
LLEQDPTNILNNYYDNIDGNTAYIKSSYGYTTTFGNRYAHFYDWTISTPNACARIPVIAYVGSCPAGLPIELVSFDGKAYNGFNKLQWITASETNTDYFIIERAGSDGIYESIGRVEAKGNASVLSEYNFTDGSLPVGGAYYRLVQFDIDGQKYYSNAIYIAIYQSDEVSIFPNPANTLVTIRSEKSNSEFTTVEITDVFGKQLIFQPGNASEKTIDISALQNGIYFIRVSFNGSIETIRLIKN